MNMDKLTSLLQDIRDKWEDEELLIQEYSRTEGKTALDVLVEQESRREAIELLRSIDKILDPTDRKILEYYIIDNMTQEEIAYRLKLNQSAISMRIKRIPLKLKKYSDKIAHFDNYSEGNFFITKKYEDRGNKISCGFPFELLQNINVGGYWGKCNGKRNSIYLSRSKCVIPEYLQKSFNSNKIVCTLCTKCKRKDVINCEE